MGPLEHFVSISRLLIGKYQISGDQQSCKCPRNALLCHRHPPPPHPLGVGVAARCGWTQEDDELEGGTKLMVTVNKMEEGKGRSKRTRYKCTVTLHGIDERRISGLNRFRPTHSSDPRDSEDAKQALMSAAMADFQRQKRERDADNLEDTDEDDDGGAYLVCCCPSPILRSRTCVHLLCFPWESPCLFGVLSVSPTEL